jgi:hypothetical protein
MIGSFLAACLVAGYASGICHTLLPDDIPPLLPPAWATPRWVHDAAGIVAGETVPDCAECDAWVACTIIEDVTLRGYHPWRLRPGRWHGWREPGERHYKAIRRALRGHCASAPECAYLGSFSDYTGHWRFNLAQAQPVLAIGNSRGVIVCIPDQPHVQQ